MEGFSRDGFLLSKIEMIPKTALQARSSCMLRRCSPFNVALNLCFRPDVCARMVMIINSDAPSVYAKRSRFSNLRLAINRDDLHAVA
jgi:hypothetical protein